jgi:hypothetical protein
MGWLRGLSRILLTISGIALALGCFGLVAHGARGPINLQAGFALVWLMSLWAGATGRRMEAATDAPFTARRSLGAWVIPLGLWVFGLFLLGRAVDQPFLSDDFHLVFGDPYSVSLFWTAGGEGFYRPVGQFVMWVARQTIPPTEVAWGVWGLALNLATSLAVGGLAYCVAGEDPAEAGAREHRRLLAWWTSALFLVHGAHLEAAVWVAGRFDVLATILVIAGLLAALRWMRGGAGGFLAASLAAMTAAVATKEIAYGFPLLVALCGWYAGMARRKILVASGLHLLVALALILFRFWMFAGPGGYIHEASGAPEVLNVTLLHVVKVVFTRLFAVLLFPVNWSVWPSPAEAAAITGGIVALVVLAWRDGPARRHLFFGGVWTLIAAGPAVAQLLLGADLSRSRLLYLPSVGFCMLVGRWVANLPHRVWARVAQAGIAVASLVVLNHNLTIWRSTGEMVARACQQAAQIARRDPRPIQFDGLPNAINGVYAFANGFPVCVAHFSGRPEESFDNRSDSYEEPFDQEPAVWAWDPRAGMLRQQDQGPSSAGLGGAWRRSPDRR